MHWCLKIDTNSISSRGFWIQLNMCVNQMHEDLCVNAGFGLRFHLNSSSNHWIGTWGILEIRWLSVYFLSFNSRLRSPNSVEFHFNSVLILAFIYCIWTIWSKEIPCISWSNRLIIFGSDLSCTLSYKLV